MVGYNCYRVRAQSKLGGVYFGGSGCKLEIEGAALGSEILMKHQRDTM